MYIYEAAVCVHIHSLHPETEATSTRIVKSLIHLRCPLFCKLWNPSNGVNAGVTEGHGIEWFHDGNGKGVILCRMLAAIRNVEAAIKLRNGDN